MSAMVCTYLPNSVKSKVRLFADDTIMYVTVKTSTDANRPARCTTRCYNQHMGGVDLLDALLALYQIPVRSQK